MVSSIPRHMPLAIRLFTYVTWIDGLDMSRIG